MISNFIRSFINSSRVLRSISKPQSINALFGPATFNNADLSSDLKVVFLPKVLTDLGIGFTLDEHASLALTVQNILNIIPEYELQAMNANGNALLADENEVKDQISYVTFNGVTRS